MHPGPMNRGVEIASTVADGPASVIREQVEMGVAVRMSVLEARMVVHGRRGQRAVVLVDDLLRLPVFEMVAPGVAETDAAYAAFVAFGKGSGHPAGLNFGAVFSYALAKLRGLPLLYKGDDFAQTDVVGVLP